MSAVRMGLDLAAKVVIVTGAARGLGQEFARSLAAAGARVVIGDVSACDATLDLVTADKGEAVGARLDVTDPQSAQALVEAGLRAFGRLDGIVNNAALAATYGMPYGLHYTTSKAAVIGLTRGLARELGRDGIRVNALAPSAVVTEGTREFFGPRVERALETIKAGQTIQRNLVPSDLTGTVAWLISDASAFITGQTIAVDGGTVLL